MIQIILLNMLKKIDKNKKNYNFWELIKIMIKQKKLLLVGIKGINYINQKRINFFKKYKPWGIILFSRNIKTIYQTQKLTSQY